MSKNEIKEKEMVKEVKENLEVMEKDLEVETTEVEKVSEEVQKAEAVKVYSDKKKLQCNYKVFKRERDFCKMKVSDECEICGKKFSDEDDVYVAFGKDLEQIFICEKCGTEKE